ncbi:DnaJ family domain-containing protein [Pectobacterium brasiliense]|uniref:DnaJ family domain-containing protein n=1 Tax=Pectobacterium brasiliense TaxID=180957 RepID=UPI000A81B990|nr:DnaJ family domain-containing protein [Pectobacterium brasiliense]
MWLIDELVEKHIRKTQEDGVFDNLSGSGSPLILDDDSGIPQELRTVYWLFACRTSRKERRFTINRLS